MKNRGSLAGIRVLDLSRMLPGPYCSMILADHGADVIAVEDRRFQEDGLFFSTVNRNKRHLSLNLKANEGKEIFFQLAEKADILLEGFRPGVVARLGVDYRSVSEVNPGIIYCSITGYGQSGPGRDRPGHDVNYMSEAGILGLIGPADGKPSIPGVQFADIAGGSMNAVTGILLALYARTRSGRGQYIDISMTDGLVGYHSLLHHFSLASGKQPVRSDDLLSHRYGCYNTYETKDGSYIALGAVENRFWQRLCDILAVPELAAAQYDDSKRSAIIETLTRIFRSRTAAEWDCLLADEDVCYSRVRSYGEMLESPMFQEREMVVDFETVDGQWVKELGIPVKLSETPGSIRSAAVGFGGSTMEILAELGYSNEQAAKLREKKIV